MAQAKGSKGRLLLDYETTFGADPSTPNGISLKFNSNSLVKTRAKNSPATITGSYNPVAPFAGNTDVGGQIVVPVDFIGFWYWLKAMFGAPTITQTGQQNLDNAAVQQYAGGRVGIQCDAHGYSAGDTIFIDGTTNYDGVYTVLASTTTNEIVIEHAYTAETIPGTAYVGSMATQQTLDNEAVQDEGGGLVGIQCDGHGYSSGDIIYIDGTTNYDGRYTVNAATTTDEIVITHAYTAETIPATATVGESTDSQTLDNEAVQNEGTGLVGIQCAAHGYSAGDTIYIDGTTNYDGEYTVHASSSADEIVITHAYTAETIPAAATVGEAPYAWEFKLSADMPSLVLEHGLTDIVEYRKFNGCKISQCSMSIGGDGELTASFTIMGASGGTPSGTPYDATPTVVEFLRAKNFQAAIQEGGSASGIIISCDLSIDFGLDGNQRVIGGGGVRGDIPQGVAKISAAVNAIYENDDLVVKAEADTETSLRVTITSGTNVLDIYLPECELEIPSVPIDGPQGVQMKTNFFAFYDNNSEGTAVVATLTNSEGGY
jgi:hypothetical protein